MDIGVRGNSRQAFVLSMYLHRCSCIGESCTFIVLFASILPDRFWGACYVRKYKLNFRNRELLDER